MSCTVFYSTTQLHALCVKELFVNKVLGPNLSFTGPPEEYPLIIDDFSVFQALMQQFIHPLTFIDEEATYTIKFTYPSFHLYERVGRGEDDFTSALNVHFEVWKKEN
jgi:hypothetical protein